MNPIVQATLRGIYGALITGGLTLLLTFQTSDSWAVAGVAAGVSGLTYLAARGGVEGTYDQHRQVTGDVQPSDVGAYSQPIRRN